MLFIGGIFAIVVFTIQVYKTAAGTERNAPLWAALTAVIGIFFQFVIPFLVGIVIAVYYLSVGTSPDNLGSEIFGLATILDVILLILSIVAMYFVSKHVSKVKDDLPGIQAPPPPPAF